MVDNQVKKYVTNQSDEVRFAGPLGSFFEKQRDMHQFVERLFLFSFFLSWLFSPVITARHTSTNFQSGFFIIFGLARIYLAVFEGHFTVYPPCVCTSVGKDEFSAGTVSGTFITASTIFVTMKCFLLSHGSANRF